MNSRIVKAVIRILFASVMLIHIILADQKQTRIHDHPAIHDEYMPRQYGFVGMETADAEYLALTQENPAKDNHLGEYASPLIIILYIVWE